MLQVVNVDALDRAAQAMVGPQVTSAIMELYKIIDQAMKDGYDLGKMDAEEGVESRTAQAFDVGFEKGLEETWGPSWDEGYLEGVGDARARPGVADETVATIISEMTAAAFNGVDVFDGEAKTNAHVEGEDWTPYFEDDAYDTSLVRDSGDETN